MPHSFCRLKTEQLICSGSFPYVSSAGPPTTDTVTPLETWKWPVSPASPSHPTSVHSPDCTDSASSVSLILVPSSLSPLPFAPTSLPSCWALFFPHRALHSSHPWLRVCPPQTQCCFTALNPVSCSSICLASAGSPFSSLKLSLTPLECIAPSSLESLQ